MSKNLSEVILTDKNNPYEKICISYIDGILLFDKISKTENTVSDTNGITITEITNIKPYPFPNNNLGNGTSNDFPIGIEFTADGGETDFNISTSILAHMLFLNGVPQSKSVWTQTGTKIELNFPLNSADFIQLI